MTNLAAKDNVVAFRPREAKVMADQPQLSDGYFRIVNALADALAMARVSQHQHQVIWAILRKTYGWGKGKDRISGSQLAEVTGLTRQQCNSALIKLIDQGIVVREGSSRGYVKINTKTAEWKVFEKGTKDNLHTNNSSSSVNTNCVRSVNTNCDHTKEQKDNIKSPNGDTSSRDDQPAPVRKVVSQKPESVPYQTILDAYHEILPELQQVRIFNDKRKRALKARWVQSPKFQTVEFWRNLFNYVRTCDFLMGRCNPAPGRKVFMADFDFITSPSGFVKIVEGKYEN